MFVNVWVTLQTSKTFSARKEWEISHYQNIKKVLKSLRFWCRIFARELPGIIFKLVKLWISSLNFTIFEIGAVYKDWRGSVQVGGSVESAAFTNFPFEFSYFRSGGRSSIEIRIFDIHEIWKSKIRNRATLAKTKK